MNLAQMHQKKLTCRPVFKHMLGDVCRRVVGGESEVLCFPADQDEAEVHLQQGQTHLRRQKRAAAQHKHQSSIPAVSASCGGTGDLALTFPDMRRPPEGCEQSGIPV